MKRWLIAIGCFAACYVLFCIFFLLNGRYAFAYQESMCTFFATAEFVRGVASAPGGAARLAAIWLAQFYHNPLAGVFIMSGLLAAVSLAVAVVIRQVSRKWYPAPLGILPAVGLGLLNYNVNYDNAGTVAFLCCFLLVALVLTLRKIWMKAVASVILTALLSWLCGPVAMLFAVVLCVIMLVENPKFAAVFILCPVLAYSLGLVYVHSGYFGDVGQAVLPRGYFTLRLKASGFVNIPWILSLAVLVLACASRFVPRRSLPARFAISALCTLVSVAYAVVGSIVSVDRNNEDFKELYCLIGRQEWGRVADKCQKLPPGSLIFQNCLNMALAERGELGDQLFLRPVLDIRSIYIEGEKTPYMQGLLSDIYYSMGHLALAQRNAFEANESLGNYSPRMLMRLAQTNLAMGHYEAAKKYARLLSHTLYYKDEAQKMLRLADDPQELVSDPELGPKAKCVFGDNRFSAYRGLDDDLKQIIRANPGYLPARQYLCALYLLSKNTPAFAQSAGEFYQGEPLPRAFAEAMLAYHSDRADSIVAEHSIPQAVVDDFRAFNLSPASRPRTYWHFFNFTK